MSSPVRIPADVDREDRLIGQLTARQLLILAAAAATVYGAWKAVPALGWAGFLTIAGPVTVVAGLLAFGRRDGIGLDRLLLAAARQRLGTRRAPRPPRRNRGAGPGRPHPSRPHPSRPHPSRPHPSHPHLGRAGAGEVGSGRGERRVQARVPIRGVRAATTGRDLGVIEVDPRHTGHTTAGGGGSALAVVIEVAPVNLALRSPAEREALIAGFGRWLNALTVPVQILTRTHPVDLTRHIADLHRHAAALPHPALTAAARDHAAHLAHLAAHTDLLARRTFLVLTQPTPLPTGEGPRRETGQRVGTVRVAEEHLRRRVADADTLLGAAGIRVTPLDAATAAHLLSAATHPERDLPASHPAPLVGNRPVPSHRGPGPRRAGPRRPGPRRQPVHRREPVAPSHPRPPGYHPDPAGPWPSPDGALSGHILNEPRVTATRPSPVDTDPTGMLAWGTAAHGSTPSAGPVEGNGDGDGDGDEVWAGRWAA